jgi:tripartite-type tricarboxylate transporter receptor subunit TctC
MTTFRLVLFLAAVFSSAIHAQPYPSKPIRLVVGFAPGGNTDTVARVVGQKLGERLGQQVVIENKAGAGGTIATGEVARSAPDGYTLTMGTTTTHAIAVAAYSKLTYDPSADFEPLAQVAVAPYLLTVRSDFPAKNLKEFVDAVKKQPGKFNYGSAGQATTTHLVMASFAHRAGLDVVHVPFKGNAPATTAILGGQIEILFGAIPPLLPHIKAGSLRPLAISSAKRSTSLPEVPTVAESGYPGFDISLWLGFFAPKGTPAPVAQRLENELIKIANSADVKEIMDKQGLEASAGSSGELAKLVKAEIEVYKTVFKAANIKME